MKYLKFTSSLFLAYLLCISCARNSTFNSSDMHMNSGFGTYVSGMKSVDDAGIAQVVKYRTIYYDNTMEYAYANGIETATCYPNSMTIFPRYIQSQDSNYYIYKWTKSKHHVITNFQDIFILLRLNNHALKPNDIAEVLSLQFPEVNSNGVVAFSIYRQDGELDFPTNWGAVVYSIDHESAHAMYCIAFEKRTILLLTRDYFITQEISAKNKISIYRTSSLNTLENNIISLNSISSFASLDGELLGCDEDVVYLRDDSGIKRYDIRASSFTDVNDHDLLTITKTYR